MNTLLRHKSLPRENGTIEFWRFKMEFVSGFSNSVYWSSRAWIDHLRGGAGQKKRCQYSTDSVEQEILYLRAIQGHSKENFVDPSLQDNVLIRRMLLQYALYHRIKIDSGRQKRQPGSTSCILYSVLDRYLKFFQMRSYAITLYDTLPPICIERVVSITTQEVKYTEIK